MATRGKSSVFAAFNQLRVSDAFDSDDGSAEEREQERKEKQKQKKKSRSKKKNSDSAQLKDLAFVSVSKPKKSKNKKNKAAQPSSPAAASPVEDVDDHVSEEKEAESVEPKRTLAELMKATPTQQMQKTAAVANGVEAPQQQKKAPSKVQQPQAQAQQKQQQQQPQSQQKQQQQSVAPKAAPVAAPSAPASGPQSSSETELGAVYSPTHITITRVDGQMKRTVAVTEVMDQLLRYTQQNSQLLMVQEQLGHANRSLQDQLQRSAEIINGLQNEVTMFRQMCLNLQAEVSLLRSSAGPDAGGNHPRAPPGMS